MGKTSICNVCVVVMILYNYLTFVLADRFSTVEPSLGAPSPLSIPVSAATPRQTPQPLTANAEPFSDVTKQLPAVDPSLSSNTVPSPDFQYLASLNLNDQPSLDTPPSSSSTNQVTTSPLNNPGDVLQALFNNPSQLQRLLSTFAVQQNMPLPSSSDTPSALNPYPSSVYPTFSQPTNGSIDVNPLLKPDEGNSQPLALTFQGNNDASLAPLIDTASQLQRSHRNAESINADVESLQADIDTLLENLGLDPETVRELHEQNVVEDPVVPIIQNDQVSGIPEIKDQTQPPEFDIDKFLTQWVNRQGNGDSSGLDSQQTQPLPTDDGHVYSNPQAIPLNDSSGYPDTLNETIAQSGIPFQGTGAPKSIIPNSTLDGDSNPKRGRKRKSQVMEGNDDDMITGRRGVSDRK